ncbi:MAG: hypothetical protein AABX96_05285 [Nanoarchaeota archaeon]
MEINGKAIIYSILILLVLFLLSVSTGLIDLKSSKSAQSTASETSQDIPEKCQVPSGQDIKSWKEHLGHHAETKDCLKYFN